MELNVYIYIYYVYIYIYIFTNTYIINSEYPIRYGAYTCITFYMCIVSIYICVSHQQTDSMDHLYQLFSFRYTRLVTSELVKPTLIVWAEGAVLFMIICLVSTMCLDISSPPDKGLHLSVTIDVS